MPETLCIGDNLDPINQHATILDNISPGAFLGEIDRNWTSSNTFGGTAQATSTEKVFGHDNHFVVGVSVDHGHTQFNATSELGTIDQNLFVNGTGVYIDQPLDDITPVNILALNTYTGIFATDTFDITSKLSLTAGARFNIAQINILDQTGTNPALNSSDHYERLNPVIGATYKFAPALTLYGGYSEANRTPTPLDVRVFKPDPALHDR